MTEAASHKPQTSSWIRDLRGQSFIEAMIAITIIVTSISSSLALVQSSITAARLGGNHVVAANLAREGIEVVRSLRDSSWLRGEAFQVGLTDVSGRKEARPYLDLSQGAWSLSFAPTSLDDANAKVYATSDGFLVQADAQPAQATISPYARVVRVDHVCRDSTTGAERIVVDVGSCGGSETLVGLAVSASVRWQTGKGAPATLTAEERLYDWR